MDDSIDLRDGASSMSLEAAEILRGEASTKWREQPCDSAELLSRPKDVKKAYLETPNYTTYIVE